MTLEDGLLEILVCPIDKGTLLYFADEAVLYNPRLRRIYRVDKGVPLMLVQPAPPVPDAEHERLLRRANSGQHRGSW